MMNSSAGDAAVLVESLRVVRGGRTVLDALDLRIPRGRITGLLGPSGCGKTTLMRSIVGVQRIAGGSVTVLGRPAGSRALRRRVSYGTQGAAVYGDLTVEQNLRYFAALQGAGRGEVERVIEVVGLGDHARVQAQRLSGGQIGRVSLGVALLGSPELVVLDEPTVGLDPVLRAQLWGTFRAVADAGTALLVSSHVMDEARRCDRLLLLREGRLLADTTPAGLLESTGRTDPEDAFLALIARAEPSRAEPSRAAPSRPEEPS